MMNNMWIAFTAFFMAANIACAAESNLPFGLRTYSDNPAPRFQLEDIDGAEIDLQALRGHWVFVHFWASWCGPCRKEMPAIEKLTQLITDDELTIVMVNVAEDEDTIFSFLGEISPTLNSFMDHDGQAVEAWQPRGLPATYLVSPDGNIRYQALGGRDWDQPEYLNFLKQLIKQPMTPIRNR